jgi:hypothetical protein
MMEPARNSPTTASGQGVGVLVGVGVGVGVFVGVFVGVGVLVGVGVGVNVAPWASIGQPDSFDAWKVLAAVV